MGNAIQRYNYDNDSFGNIQYTFPIWFIQPYTYTAREYDNETGLYFYRARYYDPRAGRFITRDPIGFKGGINFYTYAWNNPVNWTDPLGLKATCYLIKFCQIQRCYTTELAQRDECEQPFRLNPRQCIRDAENAREACIRNAEKEFDRCQCEK
jgi:RHS repeat-associated protein